MDIALQNKVAALEFILNQLIINAFPDIDSRREFADKLMKIRDENNKQQNSNDNLAMIDSFISGILNRSLSS